MPSFHIFISFFSKNSEIGKKEARIDYADEKEIHTVVEAIRKNERFLFNNHVVYPDLIDRFAIYRTENTVSQLLENENNLNKHKTFISMLLSMADELSIQTTNLC